MKDSKQIDQSTYQYKKPFRFMGKEYTDSRSLADAFIDHWDIAASVFRRGGMEGFWEEYVQDADGQSPDLSAAADFFREAYARLWDPDRIKYGEDDPVFQLVLHHIEPALNGIPFVRAEDDEAKLYSFEAFGKWLLALSADGKWEVAGNTDPFDADHWNRRLVEDMARCRVFSTYVPEIQEAEAKFYRADDDSKSRFLGELALSLQGKESFWYHNVFYTSMEELAPVMREKLCKGVDEQLFRELFDSDEYSAAFESWSAKVDGGRYREKFAEMKEGWQELSAALPHRESAGTETVDTTYGSLLERFPMEEEEVKSFLEKNVAAIARKISINQKELTCETALKSVAMAAVDVGFMRKEDMEQISSLKTVGDRIECFRQHLKNEQAYMGRLERARACFAKKRLASGWNEEDKEGKIIFLALGWHLLPAGEPDQAKALFEEVDKEWQKNQKDVSVLAEASMVLLSVLRKGLSGGWDRTSAKGESAYEQCLELIDRVSGLCVGTRLEEEWNKTCEIVRADSLEPLERALSAFSEKYQKEEASVINIVKKSGCFEGISYDGEKKVVIKCAAPSAGDKYFEVVSIIRDQQCPVTSDYLSEYRQRAEKLGRELSAIREADCSCGKLGGVIEACKRLARALKEAEDTLKSYEGKDPLMERIESRMHEIDKEYEEAEKRRKKEEEKEKREKERKTLRRAEILANIFLSPFLLVSLLFKGIRFLFEKVRSYFEKKRRFRRRSKKRSIIVIILSSVVVVLLLFYIRYASPVYYGTKYYLGSRMNYSEYKIAGFVKTIYPRTFEGVAGMTHIEIPESVTEIGWFAFSGCASLEEVTMSEGVAEIGQSAFAGCTSLKEIAIPESVTEIGQSAFSGCTSLEVVELRGSTLSLGNNLFANCGSLKEIRNEGNIVDLETLIQGKVSNCCNLDMSEVFDDLYNFAIEGVPLLENEVQLKNLLDRREIPYGEEVAERFDPVCDILTDASFGAEKTNGDVRSVDFSFEMKHRGVLYTFAGRASGQAGGHIEVELHCTDIDISELLQQLRAGDENGIWEMLDGQAVPINGLDVKLNREEIIIQEAELVEESESEYSLLLKLTSDRPLGEITLLERVELSEENAFVPELNHMYRAADRELLGTYTCSSEDGKRSVLTIDKQYEKCYSVTMDGVKQLLVLDIATESSGHLISVGEDGNFDIRPVQLNDDRDGIHIINGEIYYKTGSDVSDTAPEDITPFAGVWQGQYYYTIRDWTGGEVYWNWMDTRRYILPMGENILAMVSDYRQMGGYYYFKPCTSFDVLTYDPESGYCRIERKDWLEEAERDSRAPYYYQTDEAYVNDSYDLIWDGEDKYTTRIAKTEPDNTMGMAADPDQWSIYDASGNVKEELLVRNIPDDAFRWNGSSYYLYNDFETWEEAESYCESVGGHLAIIDSYEENMAVYSYLREQGYSEAFFGASDAAEEGKWRWVDGSSMSYTNWNRGEPNNNRDQDSAGENYIMFYSGYAYATWNDGPFKAGDMVICEWD
ncbi:MAG: leucine-rich repeat protein [Candidatus Gastranaerophilales bacterium]|nr:leucine-rich repeat protein [Candidatus Gastranaerophilales bacterium]